MFENLLNFWKGKDFLSQVFEDFQEMLNDSQEMFALVCKKLIHNEEIQGLEDKIYGIDEKINKLQKEIRRRIVEHLSLRPTVDVSACLLLMSVVKDAERLGDYCKNLFEVIELLKKPIDKGTYHSLFNGIEQNIAELFEDTKKAFIESDEDKASLSWSYETKISKRCDETIAKLAMSDLPVNEGVCLTLIARYFKRLTAHLTNIATSVILPINELDYFDEKVRDQKLGG